MVKFGKPTSKRQPAAAGSGSGQATSKRQPAAAGAVSGKPTSKRQAAAATGVPTLSEVEAEAKAAADKAAQEVMAAHQARLDKAREEERREKELARKRAAQIEAANAKAKREAGLAAKAAREKAAAEAKAAADAAKAGRKRGSRTTGKEAQGARSGKTTSKGKGKALIASEDEYDQSSESDDEVPELTADPKGTLKAFTAVLEQGRADNMPQWAISIAQRTFELDRDLERMEHRINPQLDRVHRRLGRVRGRYDGADRRLEDLEERVEQIAARQVDFEREIRSRVQGLEERIDRRVEFIRDEWRDALHHQNSWVLSRLETYGTQMNRWHERFGALEVLVGQPVPDSAGFTISLPEAPPAIYRTRAISETEEEISELQSAWYADDVRRETQHLFDRGEGSSRHHGHTATSIEGLQEDEDVDMGTADAVRPETQKRDGAGGPPVWRLVAPSTDKTTLPFGDAGVELLPPVRFASNILGQTTSLPGGAPVIRPPPTTPDAPPPTTDAQPSSNEGDLTSTAPTATDGTANRVDGTLPAMPQEPAQELPTSTGEMGQLPGSPAPQPPPVLEATVPEVRFISPTPTSSQEVALPGSPSTANTCAEDVVMAESSGDGAVPPDGNNPPAGNGNGVDHGKPGTAAEGSSRDSGGGEGSTTAGRSFPGTETAAATCEAPPPPSPTVPSEIRLHGGDTAEDIPPIVYLAPPPDTAARGRGRGRGRGRRTPSPGAHVVTRSRSGSTAGA